MPIKFRCPNVDCGRALTVGDEAAGRSGKCPGCGGLLVVPRPEPTPDDSLDGLELLPGPAYEPEPEPEPEPIPVTASRARPTLKAPAVGPAEDLDWPPPGVPAEGGPVISFDVVGLAWGLLNRGMGTWVLAVLIFGVIQIFCQLGLTLVSVLGSAAEAAAIGSPVAVSALGAMVVGLMVSEVLVGGLYKMALTQVDGGEVELADLFRIGRAAPGLAVAGLLTSLGTVVGSLFLIAPGVVFAALTMFTVPAILDGLGAVEAMKRSVGTLKRQWFAASMFLVATVLILWAGMVVPYVGLLFTLPLFVLANVVQYRRSFAPGGVPRKAVVADPWAEAVGKPAGVKGSGGVPAWAWGLVGVAVVVPLALVAVAVALVVPAVQQAAQAAANRRQAVLPGGGIDPGPEDLVTRSLGDLKRRDRRLAAVDLLAARPVEEARRPAVVAALAPLLQDPEVDDAASQALEHWAGPGDVPTLIAGLGSRKPRVRMFLMDTLRRLKARAAVPALVGLMARPEDRGNASRTLQAIGPAVSPEVRRLLTSPDEATRREAAQLLKAVAGDDQGLLRARALGILQGPDAWERDRALEDLARLPAGDDGRDEVLAAVEPLLKAPSPTTRGLALRVVGAWGPLDRLLERVDALGANDHEGQAAALAALRAANDPRATLAIVRRLELATIRGEAVQALVAMKPKDEQVEAEVLRELESPDWANRHAACLVLKAIGTPASVPALKKAAADPHRNVANAARLALKAVAPSAKPDPPAEKPKAKPNMRKKG